MLFVINIFILVALIKIVIQTDRPLMCAGVYTGVHMFFALLLGKGLSVALVGAVVGFFLAWLYFWLLTRTQESVVFWLVAIGGIVIGFV